MSGKVGGTLMSAIKGILDAGGQAVFIYCDYRALKRKNSQQGSQTNLALFYGSGKIKLPYLTLFSFSFLSMTLSLHLLLNPS